MNTPPYPHPVIAREGWPFLAGIVLISILVSFWSGAASVPFWLLSIFVLQFFRDPARVAPDGELNVLSPADGRIVAVEEVRDTYADRDALKISVFMNVFNVHSNRSPVQGSVEAVNYFPGQFFNASLDKASLENERNATVLRTSMGHVVTAVQVAGLVAKRILCYTKPGDQLYAGQRYGFIRFGSRVDVYLPLGSRPRVAIGDKVQATSTVLAELPAVATNFSDEFVNVSASADDAEPSVSKPSSSNSPADVVEQAMVTESGITVEPTTAEKVLALGRLTQAGNVVPPASTRE